MLRPYTTRIRIPTQHQVRVRRHRLPENAALPVSGARGLGARGRLQIVNEALHDAPFHETGGPGGYALVVERARRRTAWRERIVGEGESRVEHRLADPGSERRDTMQHGLAREALR